MNINILNIVCLLLFFSFNVLAGEREDNFIKGKSLDCENCKLVGLKLILMYIYGLKIEQRNYHNEKR